MSLKDELTDDPLNRGYAGMSNEEALVDLNTAYRARNRLSMTGDEVFANIANRAAWDGLTDAAKAHFLSLCARSFIDPFGSANVELVKSIFGNNSATVTNLASARVEAITRAVDLGLRSPVRINHVIAARS